MKRKFLEDLGLTKEQIDSVMAENGRDIEAEKEKAQNSSNEIKNLKNQLEEANTTITDLKQNNADNEALQAKVTEYENTIATQKAEFEEKMKNITLDTAIEKALAKANAKHSDLLSVKIDKSKLVIEEGNVKGLEEQIKALQETYKDLFGSSITGREPNNSGTASKGITKEQFNKMSYKERVELYNTNRELYNSLKE